MTRAVGRALAALVLGALLGPAWLVFFYMFQSRLEIPFDRDPPPLVTGVYPVERDEATGLTFAWTGPDATLRLPGLDRSVDWVLEGRLRGGRPDGQNPELTIEIDGVTLQTIRTGAAFESVAITIPARAERRRGLVVALHPATTFVPGPGDPRALGVMVDHLSLTPSGIVLPPRRAFAGAALAPAALGAAVALLGVTAGSAIGAAVLLSAGNALLASRGFAPYTNYPLAAIEVAVWIGLSLFVITTAAELARRQPLRNTARFVAAFSAGTLFLRLLVVFHPNMPIGDAVFHAHKLQGVLDGSFYFTSIAPGNYLFPYPPGLYLFASPLAGLVARVDLNLALLLRAVVLAVDTAAAVVLYPIVVRAWGDRTTGALAVALYHLIPLAFGVVVAGNLTNTFAQSLALLAFGLFASDWVGRHHRASIAILSATLAAAFLSHTSTFAILFVTSLTVAIVFMWKGPPPTRAAAAAVLVATFAAFVFAVVVYYAHFWETYRAVFARIGTETASGGADAGGRGIAGRALSVPRYLHIYLGTPVLALALVGGWSLNRRGARDRLTLTTAASIGSCLLFLLLGILTPVDMRYYLASIPATAVAASAGTFTLWSARGQARATGIVLLIWCLSTAVTTWWGALD